MKFSALSLAVRFALLGAIISCLTIGAALAFLIHQDRRNLSMKLIEKANFINTYYVPSMAEALAAKNDIALWQYIGRLEDDREITSVMVISDKNEIRYHRDTDKIGTPWDEENTTKALKTGEAVLSSFKNAGGQALLLISPLKIQGVSQPIGALRLELTYNHVDELIRAATGQFLPMALVLILGGGLLTWLMAKWWLSSPLSSLRENIVQINPLNLEANLPESSDEWGQVYSTLNDFIIRLKSEWQSLQGESSRQAEMEKQLIDRWLRPLLPDRILLVADKENQILGSGPNVKMGPDPSRAHLMDLITDSNFANLVTAAFQKEGDVVQGDVTYEEKPYQAAVLSIPAGQSLAVKTLIVLKPTKEAV